MELQIGNRIRTFRHQRNLTQEDVATHLGVSFQAISKWERGDGYPDITILPALAAYFETTIDDLMGMNETARREQYDEINHRWASQNASGQHRENVQLMRDALKDMPNDALLLVQLATSLEKLEGTETERREYLLASAAAQEQILRCSHDSEIRSATLFNLCFTYQKLGEHAKAIDQARKLPNLYKARENALVCLQSVTEKGRVALTALPPLRWALQLHLNALAAETGISEYARKASEICAMLEAIEKEIPTPAE